MTVSELRQALDRLDIVSSHFGDFEVRIKVRKKGAIGPTPTVPIESISAGFDWDAETVIIRSGRILEEIKE